MCEFGPKGFPLCAGMVDGNDELSGFPLLSIDGRRECG